MKSTGTMMGEEIRSATNHLTPDERAKLLEEGMKKTSSKWLWMMNFCKKGGIPPADSECWKIAEKAWMQEHKAQDIIDPHIIFENWGKSPIAQILTVSIFEWEDGWIVEAGRFAWFTKSKKELDKFMKRYSINTR